MPAGSSCRCQSSLSCCCCCRLVAHEEGCCAAAELVPRCCWTRFKRACVWSGSRSSRSLITCTRYLQLTSGPCCASFASVGQGLTTYSSTSEVGRRLMSCKISPLLSPNSCVTPVPLQPAARTQHTSTCIGLLHLGSKCERSQLLLCSRCCWLLAEIGHCLGHSAAPQHNTCQDVSKLQSTGQAPAAHKCSSSSTLCPCCHSSAPLAPRRWSAAQSPCSAFAAAVVMFSEVQRQQLCLWR